MQEERKKRNLGLRGNFERKKQQDISRWQNELSHCRNVLNDLKQVSTDGMTELQVAKHRNGIHTEQYRKSSLVDKLKAAGVTVENRGRPKKAPMETYKQTHAKFTAMLKPGNLSFLKQLKEEGKLTNISAFLDELIEKYRQSMMDSEMEDPDD